MPLLTVLRAMSAKDAGAARPPRGANAEFRHS
jgi:hypothetical protein